MPAAWAAEPARVVAAIAPVAASSLLHSIIVKALPQLAAVSAAFLFKPTRTDAKRGRSVFFSTYRFRKRHPIGFWGRTKGGGPVAPPPGRRPPGRLHSGTPRTPVRRSPHGRGCTR